MMIRAYDNFYLEDAMTNMADMLDYVANDCCLDKDVFFKDFIATGLARKVSECISLPRHSP